MNMLAKNVCGLVVSFAVIGGRSWSFQTLNLGVFKTERDKLFVLISMILCADSVATYASLNQILCLEYVNGPKFTISLKNNFLRRNLRIY